MITVQKDTKDIKLGWLAFLLNAAFSLSRLRNDYPTICPSTTAKSLESVTDSMFTAEKAVGGLGSKLMATWAINPKELSKWMDLGPDDYVRRMNWTESSVSHSSNLRHGRTRKSQKR